MPDEVATTLNGYIPDLYVASIQWPLSVFIFFFLPVSGPSPTKRLRLRSLENRTHHVYVQLGVVNPLMWCPPEKRVGYTILMYMVIHQPTHAVPFFNSFQLLHIFLFILHKIEDSTRSLLFKP